MSSPSSKGKHASSFEVPGQGYGSDELFKTKVRVGDSPRKAYMKHRDTLPPPLIAHSYFVPKATVEFLMRYKKDSALGVKFAYRSRDRITDMEGALHTFVTPFVKITMHGDYRWGPGHRVKDFGSSEGYQLGRKVLLSALIQQDYETADVMVRVSSLGSNERVGRKSLPQPISREAKQDPHVNREYDDKIRDYLVYHLTRDHGLPANTSDIRETAMSINRTLDFLAAHIEKTPPKDLPYMVRNQFFHYNGTYTSLEVMFNTAVQQIRNEMVLLEVRAKDGYVYTFNPPAIFVKFFGSNGTELLSRVHATALKYVAGSLMKFEHCRVFAWADFNSTRILPLVRKALESQPHIIVMSNDELFSGKTSAGLYNPPKEARYAMLVIHNNSDAFGQNIETEYAGGSLDGVIGEYSSAAASLMRDRKDLCDKLVEIRPI